jgi:hypothetical protein
LTLLVALFFFHREIQMNLAGIDPVIVEWAYAREVMRRLGFQPDELFFSVHANPVGPTEVIDSRTGKMIAVKGPVINLIVGAQGKTFTWTIGTTDLTAKELQKAYETLCSVWNSNEDDDLSAFKASTPFKNRLRIIKALQDKGFRLPAAEN